MSRPLAVITGASSGIGAAYACILASQGFDLLLVARREERLERIAEELSKKHSISADYFVADLSKSTDVERLSHQLQTQQVELLINNAGFGVQSDFVDAEEERLKDMIHVHVLATVSLCKAVLPGMIERDQGNIINVASVAALVHAPGSAVYPASKSFLVAFSQSLQRGLPTKKIQVQAFCPGYTYSEFHDTAAYQTFSRSSTPKLLWMTSEKAAEMSLKAMKRKKVLYIPGLINHLLVLAMRMPLISTILWQFYPRNKSNK